MTILSFCRISALAGLFFAQANNALAQRIETTPKFTDAEKAFNADPISYVDKEAYSENWSPVSEGNVLWRKRIVRSIDTRNTPNSLLNSVSGTGFTPALIEGVQKGLFKAYSNKDRVFTQELSVEELNTLLSTITTQSTSCYDLAQINKYLIKEDWIYVNDERKLISRIIGIAPVIDVEQPDGSTTEKALFWLYYPSIRAFLAQQKINSDQPVQNLDQWFEDRKFTSTIREVTTLPSLSLRKK